MVQEKPLTFFWCVNKCRRFYLLQTVNSHGAGCLVGAPNSADPRSNQLPLHQQNVHEITFCNVFFFKRFYKHDSFLSSKFHFYHGFHSNLIPILNLFYSTMKRLLFLFLKSLSHVLCCSCGRSFDCYARGPAFERRDFSQNAMVQ